MVSRSDLCLYKSISSGIFRGTVGGAGGVAVHLCGSLALLASGCVCVFCISSFFCESGLLENEPTAPAEQARRHTPHSHSMLYILDFLQTYIKYARVQLRENDREVRSQSQTPANAVTPTYLPVKSPVVGFTPGNPLSVSSSATGASSLPSKQQRTSLKSWPSTGCV